MTYPDHSQLVVRVVNQDLQRVVLGGLVSYPPGDCAVDNEENPDGCHELANHAGAREPGHQDTGRCCRVVECVVKPSQSGHGLFVIGEFGGGESPYTGLKEDLQRVQRDSATCQCIDLYTYLRYRVPDVGCS